MEDSKEKKDIKKENLFNFEVWMVCGGLMEDPDIHLEHRDIIRAKSPKQAEKLYTKKHGDYFPARCLGKV